MKRSPALLAVMLALVGAAPFRPFVAAGIDERRDAALPMTLALTDDQGRPTTLAALAGGRPLLLAPVLHDCPNLCDVTLDGLVAAMRKDGLVGDREASVVAFGIDPKETVGDARLSLQRLTARHPELADRVHATVAPASTVQAVTAALGYRFAFDARAGQYAHPAAVAVVAPAGRLSSWLFGLSPDPVALAAAVRSAQAGRPPDWATPLLLLCYHYDAATGTYGLAIERLLQLGGMAVVLGLVGFILFTRRRDEAAN